MTTTHLLMGFSWIVGVLSGFGGAISLRAYRTQKKSQQMVEEYKDQLKQDLEKKF